MTTVIEIPLAIATLSSLEPFFKLSTALSSAIPLFYYKIGACLEPDSAPAGRFLLRKNSLRSNSFRLKNLPAGVVFKHVLGGQNDHVATLVGEIASLQRELVDGLHTLLAGFFQKLLECLLVV